MSATATFPTYKLINKLDDKRTCRDLVKGNFIEYMGVVMVIEHADPYLIDLRQPTDLELEIYRDRAAYLDDPWNTFPKWKKALFMAGACLLPIIGSIDTINF